ncbi:MAG: hypothetical protein OSA99_10795 [Acidimicrobiales bacterium]|nr:hypothetical protein [Acidimicrobiales bacterium]
MSMSRHVIAVLAAATITLVACGDDAESGATRDTTETTVEAAEEQQFPDVVDVEVTAEGDGDFTVAVTLSSPYDSPDRYADAWRVLDEDGNELGVRELTHDHASEQPFTRQTTVAIPDDVERITVEGRDQVSGYGGETATVDVPR